MFSKLLHKKEGCHQFHWKNEIGIGTELKHSFSRIFPSTFQELVNSSKNLILNTQYLALFVFFFVFKETKKLNLLIKTAIDKTLHFSIYKIPS